MAQYSSKTTTNNYTIYLLVENVDKDISGNRSKVQYRAWITGNSGTSAWGSGTWSVNINGTSTSGSLSYNFADQKTWYCAGTATSYVKTGYIDHDDDGTKSIDVKFSFSGSTLVGSASINQSFALDTIERVSTLSDLTTSCNTNGILNFTINRASNNFRHSLKLSYDGSTFNEVWSEGHGTGAIQTGALQLPASVVSGVNDTSWPWVPSWFKQSMVKDSITSKTATLRLDTYSGTTMNSSTLIGSEPYTITINIKRISTSSYTFSPTGSTHYTTSTITISHTTGLDTDIISKVIVRRTCNSTTKSNTFSGSAVNDDFSGLSNDFESSIIYATSGTVSVLIDVYGKYTENSSIVENKLYTYAPATYIVTVDTNAFKPTISGVSKYLLNPSEYTTEYYLAGYTGVRFTFNISIHGHAGLDTSKTSVSITPSSAISSYRAVSTGVYEVYLNKSSSNVNISASLSITDTRGTSTSSSSSQSFYGYTPPTFSQALVRRSNSDGTENSRGTSAYFNVTAQKSSSNSTAVNLSKLKITYNNGNVAEETGDGPLSITGVKGSNDYAFTNTYTFVVTATDTYGISTTTNITLQKFDIPLSLHKNNGVGLGTLATAGHISLGIPVNTDIYFDGGSGSERKIYWKEGTWGDQFAIVPAFSGGDDSNKLIIKSAVGANNTNPDLVDRVTIAGSTGNVNITTGELSLSAGLLKVTKNSNTVTIGSQNSAFTHIYNSASIPFIFNNSVATTAGDLGTARYQWNNAYIKGALNLVGDLNLNTSGTSSNDSADIVWHYGDSSEKMRIWTANDYTDIRGPNFRLYNTSGTSLFSGRLAVAAYRQATNDASSTATSATAGTYTQITFSNIESNNISTDTSGVFKALNNSIQVLKAGKYRISGSVYMGTGTDTSSTKGRAAAHIFKRSNGGSFNSGSSYEQIGNALYGNGTDVVVTIPPKIHTLAANDVIYLAARAIGVAGNIYMGNKSTYLLIELVSN